MTDEKKRTLQKLKAELDERRADDPDVQRLSRSLGGLLNDEATLRREDSSQWDELRVEIEQYKAEHPEIIALLNRIATTLSDMGI